MAPRSTRTGAGRVAGEQLLQDCSGGKSFPRIARCSAAATGAAIVERHFSAAITIGSQFDSSPAETGVSITVSRRRFTQNHSNGPKLEVFAKPAIPIRVM